LIVGISQQAVSATEIIQTLQLEVRMTKRKFHHNGESINKLGTLLSLSIVLIALHLNPQFVILINLPTDLRVLLQSNLGKFVQPTGSRQLHLRIVEET